MLLSVLNKEDNREIFLNQAIRRVGISEVKDENGKNYAVFDFATEIYNSPHNDKVELKIGAKKTTKKDVAESWGAAVNGIEYLNSHEV